jgi:hypothetical protein
VSTSWLEIIEAMAVVLFWTLIHADNLIELAVITSVGWSLLWLVYHYGVYL